MPRAPVAPRWHTAALVALYLAVALAGALLQAHDAPTAAPPVTHGRVVGAYLPMLAAQWATLVYVARVGRPAWALRALIEARARVSDLALGALVWALVAGAELAWSHVAEGATPPSVAALLPQTVPERLTWAVVAVSVGFCEEVTFRGYLQRQFEALTGRAGAAVAMQAVVFGVAHAEQGLAAAARVALYGLGLGALARWRGSLWPGVACHVANDLAAGLLGA